jgi:hypothetical protein
LSGGGESASCTRDVANTAAIGSDSALAGDNSCSLRGGRGSLSGRGGRRSSRSGRLGLGGRSGLTTLDRSKLAVTLLLDSHLLEHGVCLLGGRVDGENHALTTVVALLAVEPQRSVNHDLHGNLRRRRDSVVGVGHESRVHTSVHKITRSGEAGLGDSVVLWQELKDDGVTDRDIVELFGLVDKTSRASNSDGVRCGGGRLSGYLSTLGHGLSNCDLLVDSCGLGTSSRVVPDDDDLRLVFLGDTGVDNLCGLLDNMLSRGGGSRSRMLSGRSNNMLCRRSGNGMLRSCRHGHGRLRVVSSNEAASKNHWRKSGHCESWSLHDVVLGIKK